MKKSEHILILGLGGIGSYLAKRLSLDGHHITIIERDEDAIGHHKPQIDGRFILGDASDWRCWEEAEARKMDYVMAMTNDDSLNVVSAIMAERYGIAQKIIRSSTLDCWSEESPLNMQDLNIDQLIRPEELAAQEIARLLEIHIGDVTEEVADGALQVVAVEVSRKSALAKMLIKDLADKFDDFPFQIVCVARDIETIIPDGSFKILPNDRVFLLVNKSNLDKARLWIDTSKESIGRRVLIVGGGMVGGRVAQLLESSHNVVLLENDEQRAEELSFLLKNTECLHGDGSDKETLMEAGLLGMDAIITATGDNDTNIMTSVLAKHLIQVRDGEINRELGKTIALVKHEDYLVLASALGTDGAINQKVLAANVILRYIRRGHVLSVAHLYGCDAEMVELLADPDSPITKKPIYSFSRLKSRIMIGAIFQEGKWKIARGAMQIKAGDKVVCVCDPSHLGELQGLFFK